MPPDDKLIIQKLTEEKTALVTEKTSLIEKLNVSSKDIKAITVRLTTMTSENDALKQKVASHEAEKKDLQDAYKISADRINVLTKEKDDLSTMFTKLQSDHQILANTVTSLKTDNDDLKQQAKTYQTQVKDLQSKTGILEDKLTRVPIPLDVEKVPIYFKNVLDSFSKNLKTDSKSSIDYVISGMDVELKTHMMTDKNNNAVIATPKPENLDAQKDTLSTISFTIKPIPKMKVID